MFERLLRRTIKVGILTVFMPDGRQVQFGRPCSDHYIPPIAVRVADRQTAWKIALRPDLYLGEAYMDGALTIEEGTIWDLMDIIGRNLTHDRDDRMSGIVRAGKSLLRRFHRSNSLAAAKRNARHHYDLPDELYREFLDTDRQYSCAYFASNHYSLERAQAEKKRLIATKLLLAPGQTVLDIGCGWGGLALELARAAQVRVTGITLSSEQLTIARGRAERAGLDHLVTFELRDYRELGGRYDRIVSVGMFEHVGPAHYQVFFDTVSRLLTDDGVALIHSIGRRSEPTATSAWLRRHIFPGGYIPSLSEVLPVIERSGLWLTDLEVLRLHYAETLRHWRERFWAKRDRFCEAYGERFCRMWEFYLASSEMSFRHGDMMVFQSQLARRVDTVPVTRSYLGGTLRHPDAAWQDVA